jgi:predicted metal-dependent enzyme (double-stranded beta helix superfamily)
LVFDIDNFVEDCLAANEEPEPRRAVKAVVERACARTGELSTALPPERAGLFRLHVSPELTILKVVWAPGMTLRPHDHRMWAAIGIYTGGEDNTFYRRDDARLVETGGRELRPQDVLLLGDDAIHQVHNPTKQFAGAIHVYGGDFFTTPRSEWESPAAEERPFDMEGVLRHFEEENARFERERT